MLNIISCFGNLELKDIKKLNMAHRAVRFHSRSFTAYGDSYCPGSAKIRQRRILPAGEASHGFPSRYLNAFSGSPSPFSDRRLK